MRFPCAFHYPERVRDESHKLSPMPSFLCRPASKLMVFLVPAGNRRRTMSVDLPIPALLIHPFLSCSLPCLVFHFPSRSFESI